MISEELLLDFSKNIEGQLFIDKLHKAIYATDASVYRKVPLAVVYPMNSSDIQKLIRFADVNDISLIPRAAGTSLAGQCVGDGIVVDMSKHFTKILEINEKEQTVVVEPGVIRDELNRFLAPFGLFFGPNTSTSNRCMIGGMFGNNSSGTTSIKYGVTRDKILETEVLLSNGALLNFKPITGAQFFEKMNADDGLESAILKKLYEELSEPHIKKQILDNFPKPEIHRRNTGYAIDELITMQPFTTEGPLFNINKLLAGSEGTLAFTTKIKLKLDKIPPKNRVMIVAHFDSISACCSLVAPAMKHDLSACEMMDKIILDCTKNNASQLPNRFFIEGDPKAILMMEIEDDDVDRLEERRKKLIDNIQKLKLSYAFPSLYGEDINKVMELRKAGLGLLGNIIGDKKAVACIEDTAVALDDLSVYIDEFNQIMNKYGQEAVYYAHAGAGELHLRPILNLKDNEDVVLFRKITTAVAQLVKKYNGSMSGEHGDGIVRGEFVALMIGSDNYTILKEIKHVFDPKNIFNRGKIVNTPAMDESLRYLPGREEPTINTVFDFTDSLGILRATEKCNGSGDCRKTEVSPGAMCPSYHATKDEKHTTRARANALREFLTTSENDNRFNHKELKEVFDLCVSCKACANECPSNVDVSSFKAEFLYQYQKENGSSTRDKAFAYTTKLNAIASLTPGISNFLFKNSLSSTLFKKALKIHPKRSLPLLSTFQLNNSNRVVEKETANDYKIILYVDEFSKYLDGNIVTDALELLTALNYEVELFYAESGRAFISKGFLEEARQIANQNINALSKKMDDSTIVIGIEPSAVLTFRDEYLRLSDRKNMTKYVSDRVLLIEEFISSEIEKERIDASHFTKAAKKVKIHMHCHQKALANQLSTFKMLNLPENYETTIITSGCCGMAGSFGYEKEHYDISMQMGELRLFPAIRNSSEDVIVAANGTSCRHQIMDGTSRIALHPITILKNALA
ncbi:FAD-binding protein [Flavobacteriaceae bacterium R38]|nr:FAD-binding protein [Flavobacteriaceae bacterium R38]